MERIGNRNAAIWDERQECIIWNELAGTLITAPRGTSKKAAMVLEVKP